MRAARYYGVRDLRVEHDVDEPPPCGPRQVKLAPAFVGICGSDLHLYLHEAVAIKPGVVHPLSGQQLPISFGHEFAGVVTEVGEGVRRAQVGDRVAVMPLLYDGTCSACVRGAVNCCKDWGFHGIQADGGMADSLVVDERAVFKLPEGVGCDVGALVEPLAVAWHAVRYAGGLDASSTALILGAGPIGCAVYLALVAKGVRNIVVSEVAASRQQYIKELGAQHVFNPAESDIVGEVNKLSGGDGAGAIFDCAGVPVTMETAVQALQVHGIIVNVAIWSGPAPVNINNLLYKEGTIKTVFGYTALDFDEVVAALASGALEPAAMISTKIALNDLVEHGIRALAENGAEHCKVMVDLSLR